MILSPNKSQQNTWFVFSKITVFKFQHVKRNRLSTSKMIHQHESTSHLPIGTSSFSIPSPYRPYRQLVWRSAMLKTSHLQLVSHWWTIFLFVHVMKICFFLHIERNVGFKGFNMLICSCENKSSSSKLPSPEEMSRSQITDSALMKKMLVASCAVFFCPSVMIIPLSEIRFSRATLQETHISHLSEKRTSSSQPPWEGTC